MLVTGGQWGSAVCCWATCVRGGVVGLDETTLPPSPTLPRASRTAADDLGRLEELPPPPPPPDTSMPYRNMFTKERECGAAV